MKALNVLFLLMTLGPHKIPFVLLFLQGKPSEDAPEALITSTTDLDHRLKRLVSKVLSCKNHPAELKPAAMARQLEEAQVRSQIPHPY